MDRVGRLYESLLLVLARTYHICRSRMKDAPLCSVGILATMILLGLLPTVNLWVSKLLVDRITVYLPAGDARVLTPVVYIVLLQLGMSLLSHVLSESNALLSERQSQLAVFRIQQEVYLHCLSMDYSFFERPEQQNRLFRTQMQAAQASNGLFSAVVSLARKMVTIVSSGIALFVFSPALGYLAVLIAVPTLLFRVKLACRQYDLLRGRTERSRQDGYLCSLFLVLNHARDNILFDVGRHFLERWREIHNKTMKEDLSLSGIRTAVNAVLGGIASLAYAGTYVYVVWLTARANGSVGSVLMNVGLFANAQAYIQGLATDFALLYQNAVFVTDYEELMSVESQIESRVDGNALKEEIVSVEFDNVSFKYPNSPAYALKDLSFRIEAGQCICLVGNNGAGKSTVIKLLLRLYDPLHGRILINGRDLREYNPKQLRKKFGVLMQDYSRYLLSLRENIVAGDIDRADDNEGLNVAIRAAEMEKTVSRLPKGPETVLGKIFGDGEDLSIGEWQKLGLARIFFRNAGVYVLDEPTSSLDASTEATVLEQFRTRTKGKISIIVSHRFSSARVADRIIVIDSGQAAESGSHDDLMRKNGIYAELFRIQARRYTGNDGDSPPV